MCSQASTSVIEMARHGTTWRRLRGRAGGEMRMRRHGRLIAVVGLILVGLGVWIGEGSQAALPPKTAAQIDPLRMMAATRNLPTQRWTDYSLVFVK
jgi:hypothetical protein